jgi:hypothetical protein
LSELKFKLIRLLPEQYLSPCESYISHYQLVSGQLRGLVYRAMSPQLVEYHKVGEKLAVHNSLLLPHRHRPVSARFYN